MPRQKNADARFQGWDNIAWSKLGSWRVARGIVKSRCRSLAQNVFDMDTAPLFPVNDDLLMVLAECDSSREWLAIKPEVMAIGFEQVEGKDGKMYWSHPNITEARKRANAAYKARKTGADKTNENKRTKKAVAEENTVDIELDGRFERERELVDWLLINFGDGKRKVTAKVKTSALAKLQPLIAGTSKEFLQVMSLMIASVSKENYVPRDMFEHCATQDKLIETLITKLPKLLVDKDCGQCATAWLAGDTEPMKLFCKGVVVKKVGGGLDWEDVNQVITADDI